MNAMKEAKSKSMEFYNRRRAQGLCPRCGGAPDPGYASCGPCRAKKPVKKRNLFKTSQLLRAYSFVVRGGKIHPDIYK